MDKGKNGKVIFCFMVTLMMILSSALAEPQKIAEPGRPVVRTQTTSKPVFDPEMTTENASAYRMSDGTDPLHLQFGSGTFQRVEYRQIQLLPEVQDVNREGQDFFRKENERRQAFFDDLVKQGLSDEARARRMNAFQQEAERRRADFAAEQTKKMTEIICENDPETACPEEGSFLERLFS